MRQGAGDGGRGIWDGEPMWCGAAEAVHSMSLFEHSSAGAGSAPTESDC